MASTISLGGKGSSLSSSSVYKISTGIAQVRIDSSALERLSTGNQNPKTALKKSSCLAIPEELTIEETRASLTVLLKKLLLSHSSSTAIRMILPVIISEGLNSNLENFSLIGMTEGECDVLENSCAPLIGICSVIEHKSWALSRIVDVVAALSCEALKADVTSFSSLDSKDKDAIAVATDLKALLKGSNLVVGEEIEAVSKIPKIHGTFHDAVKNLRDVVKVELNSKKFSSGTKEVLGTRLLALLMAIKNMGECSMNRAELSFEPIENDDFRNFLQVLVMLQTWCTDCDCCYGSLEVEDSYKAANHALVVDEDYCKFAHLVNESLGTLYRIVNFEAFVAFVNLNRKTNEEDKVVLGKGTSILFQLIKDRFIGEDPEQWVKKPSFLMNPEDPGFVYFSDKVKEILQSNQHKRLLAFVSWCCRL